MKFKMFHIPKPRQFNYKPLYYVPEEEENNLSAKSDDRSDAFRSWHRETARLKKRQNINILLYVVIVIVLLLFIFL